MKLATGMKRYTWATSASVRPIDVMCSVSSGRIENPAVERSGQVSSALCARQHSRKSEVNRKFIFIIYP